MLDKRNVRLGIQIYGNLQSASFKMERVESDNKPLFMLVYHISTFDIAMLILQHRHQS